MIRPLLAAMALSAGSVSFNPPPTDGLDYEDAGRNCIALTVFTEARGEPIEGQIAVVEVIKARMDSEGFPSFPCDVVQQLQQFHGVRDLPKPSYPWDIDRAAWELALRVTDGVMLEGWTSCAAGSTYFYRGEPPELNKPLRVHCEIGLHAFASVVP